MRKLTSDLSITLFLLTIFACAGAPKKTLETTKIDTPTNDEPTEPKSVAGATENSPPEPSIDKIAEELVPSASTPTLDLLAPPSQETTSDASSSLAESTPPLPADDRMPTAYSITSESLLTEVPPTVDESIAFPELPEDLAADSKTQQMATAPESTTPAVRAITASVTRPNTEAMQPPENQETIDLSNVSIQKMRPVESMPFQNLAPARSSEEPSHAPLEVWLENEERDTPLLRQMKLAEYPEIPTRAFRRKGSVLNRYYFVREEDTPLKVATLIYGDAALNKELQRWNDGYWETGKVLFYASPLTPKDTQMLSFYSERKITPTQVTLSHGDCLRAVAMHSLRSQHSWREIAFINGIEERDFCEAGATLKIYPFDLSPVSGKKPIPRLKSLETDAVPIPKPPVVKNRTPSLPNPAPQNPVQNNVTTPSSNQTSTAFPVKSTKIAPKFAPETAIVPRVETPSTNGATVAKPREQSKASASPPTAVSRPEATPKLRSEEPPPRKVSSGVVSSGGEAVNASPPKDAKKERTPASESAPAENVPSVSSNASQSTAGERPASNPSPEP